MHTSKDDRSLPSVTEIIGKIYTFSDYARERWLESINISLQEMGKAPIALPHLMWLTQNFWDMIHQYFIARVMDLPTVPLDPEYHEFQKAIDTFMDERKPEGISFEEAVIKPWEYVGHYDLITKFQYNDEEVIALCDVKTYQSYRHIMKLPIKDTDAKKPKLLWNKSKVQLQLSMYRDAIQDDTLKLFCFHVTPEKVDIVPLKYDVSKYEEYKQSLLWS